MLPKQEIKLLVLRARVLGAIPPAPVAAFRDPKLFLSKAYLLRAQPGLEGVSSKEVVGVRQQVPGFVVLLGADPDVEVGVDPGPRRHMGQDAAGRQLERLRSGDGLEIRVPRHQAIKALQEFPAVARIVLPAVFAVEDHGDHCGAATGAPACSPDALVEVVSGGVGLHSGVHEADEVGKLVVAEEDADSQTSLPAAGKAVGAVELVSPRNGTVGLTIEAHLERTAQHPLVGRRPHKALRGRESQGLV